MLRLCELLGSQDEQLERVRSAHQNVCVAWGAFACTDHTLTTPHKHYVWTDHCC
jgi:hypothetical protein